MLWRWRRSSDRGFVKRNFLFYGIMLVEIELTESVR